MHESEQCLNSVAASAPLRLDIGGFLDQAPVATILHDEEPCTVGIALDLRTHVSVSPAANVEILNGSLDKWRFDRKQLPLDHQCGLINACILALGIDNVRVECRYEAPIRAGLGGSGSLAVAVCGALKTALGASLQTVDEKMRLVQIAHNIENGLFSITGFQDQAAAAFGGVRLFRWDLHSSTPCDVSETLSTELCDELEKRLVLAYTGDTHDSSTINRDELKTFLNSVTRNGWVEINSTTKQFMSACKEADWGTACDAFDAENEIRISLVNQVLNAKASDLRAEAHRLGAGFSIPGAGGGGCVAAICRTDEDAEALAHNWKALLAESGTSSVLSVKIAHEGFRTHVVEC